jgi:hypothetical protein
VLTGSLVAENVDLGKSFGEIFRPVLALHDKKIFLAFKVEKV